MDLVILFRVFVLGSRVAKVKVNLNKLIKPDCSNLVDGKSVRRDTRETRRSPGAEIIRVRLASNLEV